MTCNGGLLTKYFPKSRIDLIVRRDVQTFRRSSWIDVDTFIYTNHFKMHHFALFSAMAGIGK